MKSCTRHINCLSSLAAYLDFSLNFKWPMFSIRFCDSRENKQKTQNNTEIFKVSKPKCVKLGLKMGLPRDPMCPTFGPIFNWVWVQDRSRDPTKFGVLIHGFMSRYILYTEKWRRVGFWLGLDPIPLFESGSLCIFYYYKKKKEKKKNWMGLWYVPGFKPRSWFGSSIWVLERVCAVWP